MDLHSVYNEEALLAVTTRGASGFAPVSARPTLLWWSGLVLTLTGLIIPIWAVAVPPLLDYPNHLARCFFIAFGATDPVMQRIFAVRWSVIPNLGVDIILPPLMHVVPPLIAGKAVVALAVLLPTTGAIALSYSCFRRWSLWQLGSGLVAYNAIFLTGMLNFQLAVGVALWGAACWIGLARHTLVQILAGAAFALAAFICHLFGYAFFAVLIGSAEFALYLDQGGEGADRRSVALRRVAACTVALALPAALYLLSPFAGAPAAATWPTPWHKLGLLLVPVMAYSMTISLIVAAALVAAVARWTWQRHLLVAKLAVVAIPALLAIFFILPGEAKGGSWIDARVPVMLGFMLFATLVPVRLGSREATVVSLTLAALFVARMTFITGVWLGSQTDIADVRSVIATVMPGSRILVVDGSAGNTVSAPPGKTYWIPAHRLGKAFWHDGAFAFIDRRAFWSDAFTIPGQQPVVALPPYDKSGDGGATSPARLKALWTALPAILPAHGESLPSRNARTYLLSWTTVFDYVLVLGSDGVPLTLPPASRHLDLIDAHGIAALFRVNR